MCVFTCARFAFPTPEIIDLRKGLAEFHFV